MKIIKQKLNTKGFTLVEVIVVLVILAILIAIAVPALTGYIDRASEKKIIAECRQAVVAAQTIGNENYVTTGSKLNGNLPADGAVMKDIIKLSEIPAEGKIDHIIYTNSSVNELQYTNDGITVLYKNDKYTIASKSDSAGDGGGAPVKPEDTMTSLSVFNPATGQYVNVNVAGNIIGQRTSAVKGKIVWFSGNDKYEEGYYYINAWQNILMNETDFNKFIEEITNNDKNPTTFRKIDVATPARLYDGPAESNFPTNPEKNANVFRGHFYYVNFEWDNDTEPVLAVFIGATDAWGYRGDLSLASNKALWVLASDL